ncbi:hypothetical protein NsoK4_01695 [Nitrosopumilus sp. K4]|nr:hypothetical protein NsoK4_01695 [Nitrosopumilus sp. K4]
MPNVNTLLKISIGLMIVAIISSAFVYAETVSVTVDGTSYDIDYTGTGVSVTSVEADLDLPTLILSVDVTADDVGILEISLERSFFDSKYQGDDDLFFVVVDGLDVEFIEEKTSTMRTLTIELPSGTQDVEIIGSVFGSPVEEPPTEPETPVEEPPTEPETPVEEPTAEPETPVEEPKVVPPTTTKPPVTKPKTECGPGTILKDGVCVLDQRCGPGTVLKDGACVLEPEPKTAPSTDVKGIGKELVIGLIAAFVVAGAVGIILGLISKASKSRD